MIIPQYRFEENKEVKECMGFGGRKANPLPEKVKG